ncbi:MAG TPA: zinc-binding dehydrogenase, partial [Bacteroidales bacterium]|nr:zinc-binding dehydrogenase [Bacteroidales bacterium]
HACYHTSPGSYIHQMEIVNGGKMAILAGVGPMGLAAINYVIHRKDRNPRLMVVTDIDQARLGRAAILYSPKEAADNGIELQYVNTGILKNPTSTLLEITEGTGYNDVFVFAPVGQVVEQGDAILAFDGCLNFFAGPGDPNFKAKFNFYNVHYNFTHIVGTSGGNNNDMKEAIDMMSGGLDPAGLVTHIGGLDAVIPATLNLPDIPGGKKLIYTHIEMPLTALGDFSRKGRKNPFFRRLSEITRKHNGLWSPEAEEYLMNNAESI